MTSSSELDFRSVFTVIPILVLVKMSKLTGNSCKAFRRSRAPSCPCEKFKK